ncbi:unnamed protein product, partial [Urochloa humidicola]
QATGTRTNPSASCLGGCGGPATLSPSSRRRRRRRDSRYRRRRPRRQPPPWRGGRGGGRDRAARVRARLVLPPGGALLPPRCPPRRRRHRLGRCLLPLPLRRLRPPRLPLPLLRRRRRRRRRRHLLLPVDKKAVFRQISAGSAPLSRILTTAGSASPSPPSPTASTVESAPPSPTRNLTSGSLLLGTPLRSSSTASPFLKLLNSCATRFLIWTSSTCDCLWES